MDTRDYVYIAVCAALMAICSWISIPTTIPFTLQTLGVFLSVGLLGGKRGTLAIIIYILMGAIGLPVFANFQGGIGCILGTTGGYIFGFVLSAIIMWIFEATLGKKDMVLITSMVIGLLACYTVGVFWFVSVYAKTNEPVGIMTTLAWCVFPFVIPDLIKIGIAFYLTKRLSPLINQKK